MVLMEPIYTYTYLHMRKAWKMGVHSLLHSSAPSLLTSLYGASRAGALIVKRFKERPRRPWGIWSLDVAKQCLGNLWAHLLNMIIASKSALTARP
jgi:hypothetical protein